MATFTVTTAPWDVGTVVNAYYAEAWPDRSRSPSGSSLASGTVSVTNTVTFEDLEENRRYVAWAGGQGVQFLVSSSLQAPPARAMTDRERIQQLEDQVSALDTTGGLGDATLGVVVYDEDLGAWTPRPEGAQAVVWIGPEAPLIGGTGAVDGVDVWVPTVEDT